MFSKPNKVISQEGISLKIQAISERLSSVNVVYKDSETVYQHLGLIFKLEELEKLHQSIGDAIEQARNWENTGSWPGSDALDWCSDDGIEST